MVNTYITHVNTYITHINTYITHVNTYITHVKNTQYIKEGTYVYVALYTEKFNNTEF